DPPASAGGRRIAVAALGVIALLLWLVLYPNLFVLADSVRGDTGLTLSNYARFFTSRAELRALWNSVWISAASVVLSALVGVPHALRVSRREFPGRRRLGALAALPVALPPLVRVIAVLFRYGGAGYPARSVQELLGLSASPWRL